MTISKDHVVEIAYTLTDDNGKVLDSSQGRGPLAYLHGARNIIPGLESELEGKTIGDALKVTVAPAQAYGERNDKLINEVPRTELAQIPDLQVGIQLQAQSPQGVQIFTVTAVGDDTVTLDGNHPLAGMTLHFDVQIVHVRKATEEELAHGHVHGPGGHQH
ncbi:MAG: peptidylprolyl isomerase [Bdellovibrionaceae bacterium]|nr:peptidylprolyl isomerase [Bdellovibrionales bacterium]MCB9083255.1 peptidylprolyl isomerase [Pseudobdellovibrionaceae bacterium]